VPSYRVVYGRLRAVTFKRIADGGSIQPHDRPLVEQYLRG
jgi:hypothetical protein